MILASKTRIIGGYTSLYGVQNSLVDTREMTTVIRVPHICIPRIKDSAAAVIPMLVLILV